jgi:hypothetical protein
MVAVVQKTKVIRGPGLEMVRTQTNGLDSLAAYLLVSDITRAFSKEAPPQSPGLRAAFDAALTSGQKTGLALPSNKRMSTALVETDEWRSIKDVSCCWTGTMTAYTEPDATFSKSKMFSPELKAIVYTDPVSNLRWIFPIGDYGKEKDAILVADHPNYVLEVSHDEILVKLNAVDILYNFPAKDGLYLGDTKYDIPTGDRIYDINDIARAIRAAHPKIRSLVRVDGAGRVGLIARDLYTDQFFTHRRIIGLYSNPSDHFGVVVEAPGGNVTRNLAPSDRDAEEKEERRTTFINAKANLEEFFRDLPPEKREALRRFL